MQATPLRPQWGPVTLQWSWETEGRCAWSQGPWGGVQTVGGAQDSDNLGACFFFFYFIRLLALLTVCRTVIFSLRVLEKSVC